MALYQKGRYIEAEKAFRAIVVERERLHGAEDPDTLAARNNLANALSACGRYADAEKEHRLVLAIRERLFGLQDMETLSSRNNLATALQAPGKLVEAEKNFGKSWRPVSGILAHSTLTF